MEFNEVNKLLGNKTNTKNIISQMSSMGEQAPFIVKEIVMMLADNSVYSGIIPDNYKIALAIMLQMYFNTCFDYFGEGSKLSKTFDYASIITYKVNAPDGLRFATTNEIKDGVENLIGETVYPGGEDTYKNLALLMWTLTGNNFYYKKAGYKLQYDSEFKVITTTYEMITESCEHLKQMMEWVNTSSFEKSLRIINKIKKSHGYKYADYEKDEIHEQISIKQLISTLDKVVPRGSDNPDYRKAIALIIKTNKNDKKLEPLEIAYLRKVYREIVSNNNKKISNAVDNTLKEKCEYLIDAKNRGLVDPKHFAFVIISTISKYGYKKASDKQMTIINEAYNIASNAEKKESEKGKSEVISDDEIDNTLASISNAIGQGLFEDEED